ncbi:hypothetical protein PRIPAC_70280 [Pristionchus pacificus]|uniref:Uncharacterized protein n=1 Tax=Pristionchus pacificus TaxID=54126 RepID=A0A2A6CFH7_PRIPA|nr:hypothetical protein PRIPAC_70280 [Pristionchus pacificus]|eukprot:PDM76879.1 hypothetical protein PRIPAC_42274 [Pristionchus pacificus]
MPINHLRLFAYFTAYAAACLWAAVLYRHFTTEVKPEPMVIEAQQSHQAVASEAKPELYQGEGGEEGKEVKEEG